MQMRKRVAIHVIIIVAIIVIVIPLALSLQTQSVSASEWINMNNNPPIVFYLREGQTVTGSLDYNSEPNTHGAWYLIIDPNGNEATEQTTEDVYFGGEGEHGTFTFTAKIAGEWSIHISNANAPYGGSLSYSYTISTSSILGVNPIVLICLVVAVGVSAELAFYLGIKKKKAEKSPSSTTAEEGI